MAEVLDVMSGEFVWGECDCTTAASEVFRRLYGIDPMGPLRGAYDSAQGAARLVRAYGGFEALCAQRAQASGLREGIGEPGEIGMFDNGLMRRGLVICTAPGVWQGKAPVGTAPVYEISRSWRA